MRDRGVPGTGSLLWMFAPLAMAMILPAAEFTTAPSVVPNPNPEVPLAALVRFTSSRARDHHRHGLGRRSPLGCAVWPAIQSGGGIASGRILPGPEAPDRGGNPRFGRQDPARAQASGIHRAAAPGRGRGVSPHPGEDRGYARHGARLDPAQRSPAAPGGAGGSGGRAAPAGRTGVRHRLRTHPAIDEHGQVVWYYKGSNRIADVHRLRNGNIAFLTNDNRLVEIDLLGNVQGNWCAARRPKARARAFPWTPSRCTTASPNCPTATSWS